MKFLFLILLPVFAFADVKTDSFIIQINDRSMKVLSPEKRRDIFAVLVENRSLSDQIGKFSVKGTNIKFISVKSGSTESVEIENKTSAPVVFVPLSPSFQDAELNFGKKAYEIPSKE